MNKFIHTNDYVKTRRTLCVTFGKPAERVVAVLWEEDWVSLRENDGKGIERTALRTGRAAEAMALRNMVDYTSSGG